MVGIIVKLLFYLIRLMPVRIAGATGAGIGRLFYRLDRRHRAIAIKNLQRIYPQKDAQWHHYTARESCAELGRTCFELPHVFLRSRAFLLSRIEIEGEELLQQALSHQQGAILTACHHSNWELGALTFSLLGYENDSLYRPIRQKPIDLFISRARSRFGSTLRSRDDGLRWIPKALKENHCICFMVDQHLSGGVPVPFLGHLARTTTLPASIHSKYGTPMLAVILHRIGTGFHFRLQFQAIELPDDVNNQVDQLKVISDSFAPAIHARPELWLWIHRRWLYLDEQEREAA